MQRTACAVLFIVYYYSQLVGNFPLEYDYKIGRLRITKRITIYTAIVNIGLFCTVLLLYKDELRGKRSVYSNKLHEGVFVTVALGRSIGAITAQFFYWLKRHECIAIFDEFQKLRETHFRRIHVKSGHKQRHYKAIVLKFFWATLAEISLFVSCAYGLSRDISWYLIIRLALSSILQGVQNVVFFHYHLAILSIVRHFTILNDELERILDFKLSLTPLCINKRCRKTQKDLENLMLAHWKLIKIADRVLGLFDWQRSTIMLYMYFYSIGMMYMYYTSFIRGNPMFNMSLTGWLLTGLCYVSHQQDAKLHTDLAMDLSKLTRKGSELLRDKMPCGNILEENLEKSLDIFCIQLATKGIHTSMLGLFTFDRNMAFRTFASACGNSIVLMLYDYQYY